MRRRWIISAAMEMAISSGSSASMATPIGRGRASPSPLVKARRREHARRRGAHVSAAKDVGQALGAERLDVRGRNLRGRVGVGDLTPLLHQRKPGAARNGAARFLAMVLGHIALERARDKRFKVDDEVADAPIGQDVGNLLEQRRLGRVQVQMAPPQIIPVSEFSPPMV